MNIVLLDQFLRLAAGGRGTAGRVSDDQFDLSACQRVLALLQEHRQREVHIDAAGGEGAGLGGEQTDTNWFAALCGDNIGGGQTGNTRAGNAADELSSRYRHESP